MENLKSHIFIILESETLSR